MLSLSSKSIQTITGKNISYKFSRFPYKNYSSPNNKTLVKEYPVRFIDYFLKPSYYNYIDNSLFIEKILKNNFTELILFPENYGKTFNLETLRFFLSSNSLIDERVDKQMRTNFFENTRILNTHTYNTHFGKYPVVTINFRELDQNNYKDNVEKFRFLVNLQFEQILQYLQSKEHKDSLTNIDIKNIEDFFSNYKNSKEILLFNYCKDLTKLLLKITKQNPFVLVDDYDYPLLNSFKYGFYEDMLTFMESFFNISIKNNNFINKSIVTGVNKANYNKLFLQFYNVIEYKDEREKYFSLKEEILFRVNKEKLSEDLNLKEFFNNLIDENSDNYIAGIKTLVNLKNISLKEDNQLNQNDAESCNTAQNTSIEFSKKISSDFIEHYLRYNGILNNPSHIGSAFYKDILRTSLPLLDDPNSMNFGYNKKLAYSYYNYLFNNNLEGFMEYVKCLFEFVAKIVKNKKLQSPSNLLPDFNLQFRSEKDFESYLIDILTLEMNNENSNEKIQIYSIDDDESTILKSELKKFTLITYDDKKFAIFLKGNKLKRQGENLKKEEDIIQENNLDEIMNNPNIKIPSIKFNIEKPTSKRQFIIVPPEIIQEELKKKNEQTLQPIDRQEAINFLTKISTDFETVYFLTVTNYNKQIDYLMEIVKLEKE